MLNGWLDRRNNSDMVVPKNPGNCRDVVLAASIEADRQPFILVSASGMHGTGDRGCQDDTLS